MSYPVSWTDSQTIDNFIQNFYDAVRPEEFGSRFKTEFSDGTIRMSSDAGFSKDWLFYIGASSKRNGGTFAGRFGEGFKIASLSAIRDLKLSVHMESRDWTLDVTEDDDVIDGRPVKVLAYDIGERPYEENSVLVLGHANQALYDIALERKTWFLYDGNPRLGECIAKGSDYAVYHTAKENGKSGYIFLNHELRAFLREPLVLCLEGYVPDRDDRDRIILNDTAKSRIIAEVFEKLDPEPAFTVLVLLRRCWGGHRKGGVFDDRTDWKRALGILIDIIACDEDVRKRFLDQYGDGLVCEPVLWWSGNDRRMANEWFRRYGPKKRRRVYSLFIRLGVTDLDTLCRENGGYDETGEPTEKEKILIGVLEEAAEAFFRDLYCYESLPSCHILLNRQAPVQGEAQTFPETDRIINSRGMRVKRRIRDVYLRRDLFRKERFSEALCTYLHELLHQYGGDCSTGFRRALMEMDTVILQNREGLLGYREKWERLTEN